MITLKRKYYDADTEVNDEVPYASFEQAIADLEFVYNEDPDIAVISRKKHADGSRSVSIIGRDNKIRLQYKTVV